MTSPSSWYGLARECRMRAAETRARADEMKEAQPKAIMLRIAADYKAIAEWAEKTQCPGGTKNGVWARASSIHFVSGQAARILSRPLSLPWATSAMSLRIIASPKDSKFFATMTKAAGPPMTLAR